LGDSLLRVDLEGSRVATHRRGVMVDVFRFESFEVDRGAFELRRAGRPVPIERIPMELLLLLLERQGQLVKRQEILDRIWGKNVFGDVDNSINTAVRKIRQALHDNPARPRLLHTVPGKGYRIAVLAVEPEAAPTAPAVLQVPLTSPPPVPATRSNPWRMRAAIAAAPVAVALIALAYWMHIVRPSGKAMIVVLPFQNLSGDAGQEYFADGMTEEMIAQLGSLDPRHLGVIARTSAMLYKGTRKDSAEIARELGVNLLLEGSVRRANDRVRVTAQLIQASDQTHLWAGSYDRDVSDILKLQSDVARGIAEKIQLTLSQQVQESLAGTRSIDPAAYEDFLQGLQASNLRTRAGYEHAISAFGRAVARDPNYAEAYAALARAEMLAPIFGVSTTVELLPKAVEAATRAIALNDNLADAHTALAFSKSHLDYDWPTAEREYRRGLTLNPGGAQVHFFYSNGYLSPFGRHDEAIAEMKTAAELDPYSPPIQSFLGRTYVWARRYDQALAQYQKANTLDPNFAVGHERLAHLYTYLGRFDDAIGEESTARTLSGEDPQVVRSREEALRKSLAAQGAHGYWQTLLANAAAGPNPPEAYDDSYGFAIIYARLGEKEKAIDSLESAYAERKIAMSEIGVEPAFDALRSDPRFRLLLRRVGLEREPAAAAGTSPSPH
jgi:TolB-like protein/DNA-binding winged helix-turn-helix (wHTH) protein/cytochrome c-type biogenesis protein CcmH/NrfG